MSTLEDDYSRLITRIEEDLKRGNIKLDTKVRVLRSDSFNPQGYRKIIQYFKRNTDSTYITTITDYFYDDENSDVPIKTLERQKDLLLEKYIQIEEKLEPMTVDELIVEIKSKILEQSLINKRTFKKILWRTK